jgi:hypothetical protein
LLSQAITSSTDIGRVSFSKVSVICAYSRRAQPIIEVKGSPQN